MTSHYLNQCWPDSLTHICGTVDVFMKIMAYSSKMIHSANVCCIQQNGYTLLKTVMYTEKIVMCSWRQWCIQPKWYPQQKCVAFRKMVMHYWRQWCIQENGSVHEDNGMLSKSVLHSAKWWCIAEDSDAFRKMMCSWRQWCIQQKWYIEQKSYTQ